MSVVAWHHGASRSIAYWAIRHEPSSFVFARCATRKDAVALAEKVYAMFPEQFWQSTDADVIAAMLQPHEHTILKRPSDDEVGIAASKAKQTIQELMNSNINIGVMPHTAENAIRRSRSRRGQSMAPR